MNNTNKIIVSIIAIIGISLLIYAGATFLPDEKFLDENQDDNTSDSTENTAKTVLAMVNGENITLQEVNETQQSYMQQGQQFTQDQILELMINQTIVIQEAVNNGYEYTDSEIESEIQSLLEQQNLTLQEYKNQLVQQGFSYNDTLQDYKEQLILQTYLDDAVQDKDLNVTETEAEDYYDVYKNQSEGEVPSYEELRTQIFDYLQQLKRQEAVNDIIKDIRKDAEITIF
jgi:parvulin-like peptidyl-prolyl isomerase